MPDMPDLPCLGLHLHRGFPVRVGQKCRWAGSQESASDRVLKLLAGGEVTFEVGFADDLETLVGKGIRATSRRGMGLNGQYKQVGQGKGGGATLRCGPGTGGTACAVAQG